MTNSFIEINFLKQKTWSSQPVKQKNFGSSLHLCVASEEMSVEIQQKVASPETNSWLLATNWIKQQSGLSKTFNLTGPVFKQVKVDKDLKSL